jgi:pimeloyl-ACP methyl ester carboxylesterase
MSSEVLGASAGLLTVSTTSGTLGELTLSIKERGAMPERVFIDTTVGKLMVTSVGAGAPVVLWHSLFVDERSWQRFTAELVGQRRLILITGPGHGASADPGRRYGLRECATAAGQVLAALDVRGPVDWVGNAWGGHVGVHFTVDHPGQVRSLVTIGTPIRALDRGERLQMKALLALYSMLGPVSFVVEPVVETMLASKTRSSDPEAVALVRSSVVEANRRRLRNAVMSISLNREDLADLLLAVSVPVLMITGSDHSGWTPAESQAAAAAVLDARSATVADAAYLAPMEQPAAVVSLVREFWATVSSARSGRLA